MAKLEPYIIRGEAVESVYRRLDSGKLCVQKSVRGVGRITISLKTIAFRTAKEARDARDRALLEYLNQAPDRPPVVSTEYVARMALEAKRTRDVKTLDEFVYTWTKYLQPFFAATPIDRVGESWKVYRDQWAAKNRAAIKPRKIDRDRKILRFIMGVALENKFIQSIPDLEVPAADRQSKETVPFSPKEVQRLLEQGKGRGHGRGLKWECLLDLALYGLRWKSIRLMEWDFIDFTERRITIPPSKVKQRKSWVFPISVETADLLQRYQATMTGADGQLLSRFVFPLRGDFSLPMSPSQKTFQRIKRDANISGRGVHAFRHTVITEAIRAGTPSVMAQKFFRVSDKVMKSVYTHVDMEDAQKMTEMARRKLRQNGAK